MTVNHRQCYTSVVTGIIPYDTSYTNIISYHMDQRMIQGMIQGMIPPLSTTVQACKVLDFDNRIAFTMSGQLRVNGESQW